MRLNKNGRIKPQKMDRIEQAWPNQTLCEIKRAWSNQTSKDG